MLTLVAAGLGISHLPEDAIRLEFRGVIALPIEPTVTVTLYAARSADRHSALVDDFLAILGTS
jgi:DNA-binding transcriptional LysR family regulator